METAKQQTPNQWMLQNRKAKAHAIAEGIVEDARARRVTLYDAMPKTDAEWFTAWKRAKVARAPSNDTKAMVALIVLEAMLNETGAVGPLAEAR